MRAPHPAPTSPPAPGGGWHARWRGTHFHDYSAAAYRMWLAIAGAGSLALAGALLALAQAAPATWAATAAGLVLVAVAAWYPLQVPRTQYSIGAADVFIFTLLSMVGTPAAVLAAGLEGLIGAWRGTTRLSSRLATPTAGMAGMAVCGLLFQGLAATLEGLGWGGAAARLAALVLVAPVPFAMTTLALMATVTLKRGAWPELRSWFGNFSWLAALYLAAALVAGIVQASAGQLGVAAVGVVALATLAVVALLRLSFAHREAEHQAQETRIADARHESELNQQRFAAAFTHAAIGMAIVDATGSVVRANQALCRLLAREEASLSGQRFVALLHPGDVELFERQTREIAARQDSLAYSIELRCLDGHGAERWVALHCGRYEEPGSSGQGLIYQVHDITSRQVAEARLQYIAFHDSLTDLPNRAYFHEQLELAVEASRVDPQVRFAVMFIDLDRFKVVNDSLGHHHGDELLREVGRRLRSALRPRDLVARLGGDEFALLLRDLEPGDDGVPLAERLLAALARPIALGGTEVAPGASIGVTFGDLGYRTVDELLRDADLAMYEAKAGGRGRVAVFDRTMHERIVDKLALEGDLRRAIGDGELSLTYQPLFELEPRRLVGFEALVRWVHPTRGPVSPAVFVALAEEAGHIEALTAWVLDKSIEQLAAWRRATPGMEHLGVNVNISGRDLVQPEFADRVLQVLCRHGVAPAMLTLEITETVLMSRLDVVRGALAQLRASGVQLAIDDFGTGYSSLSYLSTLPIDCLKIDRSFVAAMSRGGENVEIVRAVLNLGQALAKKVVAEGIETPEQYTTLRRLGVPVGQGYLLSRPMRVDEIADWLHAPLTLAA